MNKKKTLLLIVSLIVIVVLVICVIVTKKNKIELDNSINGVNIIKEKEIVKDQVIDSLKISNVSIVIIDGKTSFYAVVTNTENKDYKIDNLYVNFVMDNEVEYKILGIINTTLKPNGTTEIRLTFDSDLSTVKSVKYLLENAK